MKMCSNRSIEEKNTQAIGTTNNRENLRISTRSNNNNTAIQQNINLQEGTARNRPTPEKEETSTRPNAIDSAMLQYIDLQDNDSYTVDTSLMSGIAETGNESGLFNYLENNNDTPSEPSNANDNGTLTETSYANLENANPFLISSCDNGADKSINETFISEVLQETVKVLSINSPKILQENVDYQHVEFFNNQQCSNQFNLFIQTIEVSDVVGEPASVEDKVNFTQDLEQLNENYKLTKNNQELVGSEEQLEGQELVGGEEVEDQEFVDREVVEEQELVDREEVVEDQEFVDREEVIENQDQLVGGEEEVEVQDPADGHAEPDDIVLLQGRPKKGRKRKIPDQSRAD
ncbi:hypothetical protein J6590_005916 [Homalodisca vitripennis]|nr:hypothetical protein J6590_005916 [Homalodisca vitripennis]